MYSPVQYHNQVTSDMDIDRASNKGWLMISPGGRFRTSVYGSTTVTQNSHTACSPVKAEFALRAGCRRWHNLMNRHYTFHPDRRSYRSDRRRRAPGSASNTTRNMNREPDCRRQGAKDSTYGWLTTAGFAAISHDSGPRSSRRHRRRRTIPVEGKAEDLFGSMW